MIIPMATAPQPEVLFDFMDWVSTFSLLIVIVGTIVMVRRQLKRYKRIKKGLGSVFVWIAAAFVATSVLLNATAGPIVSLFIGDQLNLGYVKPITLAFDVFLVGIAFLLSAGIIALLTYERAPKQGRKMKPFKAGSAKLNQSADEHDEHMGTEIFSGL